MKAAYIAKKEKFVGMYFKLSGNKFKKIPNVFHTRPNNNIIVSEKRLSNTAEYGIRRIMPCTNTKQKETLPNRKDSAS